MEGLPISDEQIAALAPEFQAVVRSVVDHFEAQLAMACEQIAALKQEVARLTAELAASRKTPRNSSLPPSTEHPHSKSNSSGQTKQPKTKRRRGGQKGHPKHERKLIPPEQCDHVVPLIPDNCRGCGQPLTGVDPEPLRHQLWEIPQPAPIVTEFQRHRLQCEYCHLSTCGALPEGVAEHTAGPRLQAITVVLMALMRQSKRRTALALETLFGVPASAGWIVKLQRQALPALTPYQAEVAAEIPTAEVAFCDETPFKEGQKKTWLWSFVSPRCTLFKMSDTRAAETPQTILSTHFSGTICTDRYAGYNTWNSRRQICWAHLKRNIQAVIDGGGDGFRIGSRLMSVLNRMFTLWHRYRSGKIRHATLRRQIEAQCQYQFYEALEDGQRCSHAPTVTLCQDLFARYDQLWQFTEHVGLEPTNNRAERSLRHAVIWRKLSYGTQSESGSRFVETLLTIIETCRQQSRHLLDFLTEALSAHTSRHPAPQLIPP
jgi:transposase